MTVKSQQIDTSSYTYSGSFRVDRDGESKEVKDSFIINEDIAIKRATAEMLESKKQEVEFSTFFIPLRINDIISISAPSKRIPKELNKDRFIVKEVTHYFKAGYIRTKIKALRYEF
jgi:hypothetical protein